MDGLMDFLGDIYLILIFITLILIFALVGYFVNRKRSKGTQFKIDDNQNLNMNANNQNNVDSL